MSSQTKPATSLEGRQKKCLMQKKYFYQSCVTETEFQDWLKLYLRSKQLRKKEKEKSRQEKSKE